MKRDKPKTGHLAFKTLTICVRVIGIALLVCILALAGVIAQGLIASGGSFNDAKFAGCRVLIMEGAGMEPEIKANALVLVYSKADFDKVKKGDIIAYEPVPGNGLVLSRVWAVGDTLTVCQDGQPAELAQLVFSSQLEGVVPGHLGVFPSRVGVWNWSAYFVSDMRTVYGEMRWEQGIKWGVALLGILVIFAVIWLLLEARLRKLKKQAEDNQIFVDDMEDISSDSPLPPLPPELAPIIKKAPDGQPVSVFPGVQTEPVLGMPDDGKKLPAAPVAVPVYTPLTATAQAAPAAPPVRPVAPPVAPPVRPVPPVAPPVAPPVRPAPPVAPGPVVRPAPIPAPAQPVRPTPLPAPAPQPRPQPVPQPRPATTQPTFPTMPLPTQPQRPVPPSQPPRPPVPQAAPTRPAAPPPPPAPTGHVATDEEFAEMLRRFEQDFL